MELPLEWMGNSHRQSLGAIQANQQTPTQFSKGKVPSVSLFYGYVLLNKLYIEIYIDISICIYI